MAAAIFWPRRSQWWWWSLARNANLADDREVPVSVSRQYSPLPRSRRETIPAEYRANVRLVGPSKIRAAAKNSSGNRRDETSSRCIRAKKESVRSAKLNCRAAGSFQLFQEKDFGCAILARTSDAPVRMWREFFLGPLFENEHAIIGEHPRNGFGVQKQIGKALTGGSALIGRIRENDIELLSYVLQEFEHVLHADFAFGFGGCEIPFDRLR